MQTAGHDHYHDEIAQAEARLRRAMLDGDVNALDELISPELIFTSHTGAVFGKQDDLATHRSGLLRLHALTPSESRSTLHGNTAIVSVRVWLEGNYAGTPFSGDFRYTRVWQRADDGQWRVIAGHVGALA